MNKHFRSISKTNEQNEKDSDHLLLIDVLRNFQNHPSIRKIKSSFSDNTTLNITPVPREALRHIITNLDHKKATGHDMVNAKFLKISVNIILQPLLNILNKCILQGTFPKSLKKAVVTPVYKKKDPFNKENYRPISLLTTFSKVFEKAIELQLSPFFEKKFSKYLCAYRKHFSSQHALFRLVEDWKSGLEKNKHIGAVLMDLSKAFDCLPKNLLLAKLHAYGLEQGSLC